MASDFLLTIQSASVQSKGQVEKPHKDDALELFWQDEAVLVFIQVPESLTQTFPLQPFHELGKLVVWDDVVLAFGQERSAFSRLTCQDMGAILLSKIEFNPVAAQSGRSALIQQRKISERTNQS